MREGLIKKKEEKILFFFGTGSQNKGDDSQFCPIQLYRVMGSFVKLSSSSAISH